MEYVAKFPVLSAVCFMMDCSGGNMFETAAALEAAMATQDETEMRNADRELYAFNGDQLCWIAVGGMFSGDDYEGLGETPVISAATEALLNALYEAA